MSYLEVIRLSRPYLKNRPLWSNLKDKMQKTKITDGCHLYKKGNEGILFGAVAEVNKALINLGQGSVRILGVVLSDTRHNRGISNWYTGFSVIRNLFVDKEDEKLKILGTQEQIEAMKVILRWTLLPPTRSDYLEWADRYEGFNGSGIFKMHEAVFKKFSVNGKQPRPEHIDEMVDFVEFDEGRAKIGEFEIKKQGEKDTFVVSCDGSTEAVQLKFSTKPTASFTILGGEGHYQADMLARKPLSAGDGKDAKGGGSAYIDDVNGVPVLVDCCPYVSQMLDLRGLCFSQVGGLIQTHMHEDHFSILELMEYKRRIRVYSIPEVFEPLLMVVAAFLEIDLSVPEARKKLLERFEFIRLDDNYDSQSGHSKRVFGAEVQMFYTVHSVPCFGYRIVNTFAGQEYHLVHGSDNLGPAKLNEFMRKRIISSSWYNTLMGVYSYEESWAGHLVFCDGGDDKVLHPEPKEVIEFEGIGQRLGSTLIFMHCHEIEGADYRVASSRESYTLIRGSDEFDNRSTVSEIFTSLGVKSAFDLTVMYQRGVVREYNPGDVIIREGDEADDFFIVLSGTLGVEVGDEAREVAILRRSDFFGEVAIVFKGSKRNATIRAKSPCRLFVVSASHFSEFLEASSLMETFKAQWENRLTLMRTHVFQDLPAVVLAKLASKARVHPVGAGAVIREQGSGDTTWSIVKRGKIETGGEQSGQGTAIGLSSELGLEPDERVIAMDATTLLIFHRRELEDLRREYPGVAAL